MNRQLVGGRVLAVVLIALLVASGGVAAQDGRSSGDAPDNSTTTNESTTTPEPYEPGDDRYQQPDAPTVPGDRIGGPSSNASSFLYSFSNSTHVTGVDWSDSSVTVSLSVAAPTTVSVTDWGAAFVEVPSTVGESAITPVEGGDEYRLARGSYELSLPATVGNGVQVVSLSADDSAVSLSRRVESTGGAWIDADITGDDLRLAGGLGVVVGVFAVIIYAYRTRLRKLSQVVRV